jgi:hypothetical protein
MNKTGIIIAAYKAGLDLYSDNGLVFNSVKIKTRSITERVQALLLADTAPEVCGLVDDYEYAFTPSGKGIEASGLLLADPILNCDGFVYLYEPEFGIDILQVDIDLDSLELYLAIQI